jgi:hypothetical protein
MDSGMARPPRCRMLTMEHNHDRGRALMDRAEHRGEADQQAG